MLTHRKLWANAFLNRVFEHKPKVTMVLKKELRIFLLYLGELLNITKTKPTEAVNKKLKFC